MSRPKGVPTGVSIRILTAGSVRAITRSVGGQGGSAVGLSVGVMPDQGRRLAMLPYSKLSLRISALSKLVSVTDLRRCRPRKTGTGALLSLADHDLDGSFALQSGLSGLAIRDAQRVQNCYFLLSQTVSSLRPDSTDSGPCSSAGSRDVRERLLPKFHRRSDSVLLQHIDIVGVLKGIRTLLSP
jgi:hypothetical protein